MSCFKCLSAGDSSSASSQLTRSEPNGLDVVFRSIVFDPRPVRIVLGLDGIRVREEHLGDGAVAEEAGREGDL